MENCFDAQEVNLITCGAQATIPLVHAVNRISAVAYAELVSTISASSAGPGTRNNIDEFTVATARSLEALGGAAAGKAIMILNPARPPISMRNTLYLDVPGGDGERIRRHLHQAVAEIRQYVPGYKLLAEPIVSDDVWTVFVEVLGAGDHLPVYAGNLDIMTSAAIRVAEVIAAVETASQATAARS
jgi:acetaldehyde dehydrogenase